MCNYSEDDKLSIFHPLGTAVNTTSEHANISSIANFFEKCRRKIEECSIIQFGIVANEKGRINCQIIKTIENQINLTLIMPCAAI